MKTVTYAAVIQLDPPHPTPPALTPDMAVLEIFYQAGWADCAAMMARK